MSKLDKGKREERKKRRRMKKINKANKKIDKASPDISNPDLESLMKIKINNL
jgi:hypothetical protein